MPFQMLDLILVAIMLVSGLLALMRGFTREVLSLVAWGGAAAAAAAPLRKSRRLGTIGFMASPPCERRSVETRTPGS